MDELDKKELETFVDKIMDESNLESAPKDFTKNLMLEVELQSQRKTMEYKPVVSRRTLTVITVLFVTTLYLIATYAINDSEGWFKNLEIAPYFDGIGDWLQRYTPSKVTIYAVLLFGFMFLVQIPWLKKHIERQSMV